MRIIEVSERSSIDIPLEELLHDGGALRLRPDLIGRGLVEIKQARSSLKLQVNGLVGRLPLTDRITLDVRPKFSVSNLNRIVYASRSELQNPFFNDRPYERIRNQEYLPVPLIRSFSTVLRELIGNGVYREYTRETVSGSPKPHIDFNKTQQKYWSRLQPTFAIMEHFNFASDNLPNQCVKLAASKAIAIAKSSSHLEECVPTLAACLRQLEKITLRSPASIIGNLQSARSSVPSYRRDYAQALEQALEIIRNVDISLDSAKRGLFLESYIISLDDVFEKYIQCVVAELPDVGFGRVATVDGNIRRHQRSLFTDNKRYQIKPDLIVKDKRGVLVIGDVKYKMKPKEEDRYQIITHSLSYQVKRAILIYPKPSAQMSGGLKRLGAIGSPESIDVYEYYFDLEGDLEIEENNLRSAFHGLLV